MGSNGRLDRGSLTQGNGDVGYGHYRDIDWHCCIDRGHSPLVLQALASGVLILLPQIGPSWMLMTLVVIRHCDGADYIRSHNETDREIKISETFSQKWSRHNVARFAFVLVYASISPALLGENIRRCDHSPKISTGFMSILIRDSVSQT